MSNLVFEILLRLLKPAAAVVLGALIYAVLTGLIGAAGSAELAFDRSIDVHVSRLRAKLGDDSRSPKILKTVRGVGYLLAGGGHE